MIPYTIYKTSTGEIVFTGNASQEQEVMNMTSNGQGYLLESSQRSQYVENGKIVDMPQKPDGEYLFDFSSRQWVFNEPVARTQALYKRDQLLADGPDRISPLWWSTMTAEQQQAWTDYRQSLLDITDQPGFPADIEWPTKP